MKLWTIQPKAVYEKLKAIEIIMGSKDFIDNDDLHGYDWLVEKMEEKIGKRPSKDSYPIWAWYQYNSKRQPKPDLRRSAHLPKGTEGVRLTIEKPKEDVLLSDFILWHYPYCYKGFIGNSENETIKFEKELKISV